MTSTRVQNQGIDDSAVTTSKLADSSVTNPKLADSSVTNSKIQNAAITGSKLDGTQLGSAPIYGVRAWVQFDGTTNNPTIRASGNIATVTRVSNQIGQYFITFSIPMPDTKYAVIVTTSSGDETENDNQFGGRLIWDQMTTQGFKIKTTKADAGDSSDKMHNPSVVSILVMR